MLRLLAIGGEPASGKSKLLQALLLEIGAGRPFSHGKLLHGTFHDEKKIVVFGVYKSGEQFGGTDKLSMAVQAEAVDFLKKAAAAEKYRDWTVVFEGDRLFNASFLAQAREAGVETRCVVLHASDLCLSKRHVERGDKQDKKWLQGRKTKVRNTVGAQPRATVYYEEHETDCSTRRVVGRILSGIYFSEVRNG